jgi:hypothetical protein
MNITKCLFSSYILQNICNDIVTSNLFKSELLGWKRKKRLEDLIEPILKEHRIMNIFKYTYMNEISINSHLFILILLNY